MATELDKKPEAVRVATLLMVIGEEARDVFSTFIDWAERVMLPGYEIPTVLSAIQEYAI